MRDNTINDTSITPLPDPSVRDAALLSALMDGEVSEHELRQALQALERDPALGGVWMRYHLAQAALRHETGAFANVDLRARVAAAAAEAPAPTLLAVVTAGSRRWLRPLTSMALAASVALATVFGWQLFQSSATAPGSASWAVEPGATAGAGTQTVALGSMVVSNETDELVLPVTEAGSPTAGQDRLNAYMVRHAQATTARGMTSYARVVSLEGEKGRAP